MGPLESLGVGVAQTAVNYGMQSMFGDREQKNYEKNQAQNFKYSQEAQRNAAANTVEGLQKAGLSPALAAGMPQAAPMSQSPMQNKQAPQMDMASMFIAGKQLELQDAEKANLEQQARKLKITNDRMESEDAQYNTLLLNTVEQWKEKAPKDSTLQKLYDDILQRPEKFTKGTFDALKDATDFSALVRETAARVAKADLDNLVANMQAKGGIYKDIANLPTEELELMINDQKLKRALAVNAYAQAKTQGEELKKLQAQQKELEASAKNIEEQTSRLRYGKYGNMYEHGDYDNAIAEILGGAMQEGANEVAREAPRLGADMIRAKTGTPHGIFRSNADVKTRSEPTRTQEHTRQWYDSKGTRHEWREKRNSPFPEQE